MRRKKNMMKSHELILSFGNGFLDTAFSALRKEMEFFDMSFDNENITTIYDKKLSASK